MCRWANLQESTYYAWRDRGISATQRENERLADLIRGVFTESRCTYGYRRVAAMLTRQGHPCDLHRVLRVMRNMHLNVAVRPRKQPTTMTPGNYGGLPDLVCRKFTAAVPGQVMVADITYITSWQGHAYLATVIDCATKAIIGHAVADHMKTSLVVDALVMASETVTFQPGISIVHSDRGS